MVQALVVLLGAVIGFGGSRLLRRPANTASAASVVRNVGGALGARRGRSLPELQRATFSEMMRHVRVGRGATAVPARYLVQLHPDDAAVVEESPRFFTDGLAEALRDAAADHGWSIDGPVTINVEASDERRPGAPGVLAVAPGGSSTARLAPPPEAPAGPMAQVRSSAAEPTVTRPPSRPVNKPRAVALHRLDTDERVPLSTGPVSIGRSVDCDIVVDDTRVSRHHAVVGPHGAGWTITDGGSSNGTRLNGTALAASDAATLRAGDSIQIGPVTLRFETENAPARSTGRPPGQGQPVDATSVLDDATRQRISGEYPWARSDDVRRTDARRAANDDDDEQGRGR